MCKNSGSIQQDNAVVDANTGRYSMNQCNGIIVLSKRSKKGCYIMELTLK